MQRQLFNQILSNAWFSFAVLQAADGIEALEILKQQSVDAVLLDKMTLETRGMT